MIILSAIPVLSKSVCSCVSWVRVSLVFDITILATAGLFTEQDTWSIV